MADIDDLIDRVEFLNQAIVQVFKRLDKLERIVREEISFDGDDDDREADEDR